MDNLAKQCVESGYTNVLGMRFDKGKSDPVHNELREHGLIALKGAKGASWALTEAGKDWVMENREVEDQFAENETPRTRSKDPQRPTTDAT